MLCTTCHNHPAGDAVPPPSPPPQECSARDLPAGRCAPSPLAGGGRDGGRNPIRWRPRCAPPPLPSPVEGEGTLESPLDQICAEQYGPPPQRGRVWRMALRWPGRRSRPRVWHVFRSWLRLFLLPTAELIGEFGA